MVQQQKEGDTVMERIERLKFWRQFEKHKLVTGAFMVFATLCILYAYVLEGKGDFASFILSLATELTGIFLTFLAVNIIIQNAKDRDDVESMSMKFIHEIDYLVWVWLGGKRIFDLQELKELIHSVQKQDKLYSST